MRVGVFDGSALGGLAQFDQIAWPDRIWNKNRGYRDEPYGIRAAARAEASSHEGGCRRDGDRQGGETVAKLIGVTTDDDRRASSYW